MSGLTTAVLGGDARELRVAERLGQLGHEVRVFGLEGLDGSPVPPSRTSHEAVRGASWLICPAPGLDGDKLYAPSAAAPVTLDEAVLAESDVRQGGLILGRLSPALRELKDKMGFAVFETKDERHMAVANATSVSEGLLRLLIERTDRILREYRIMVVGYGATGVAIADSLVGARCRPVVVARDVVAMERARQLGCEPIPYADRVAAMATADIVVNTVPQTDAIPPDAYPVLGSALVVDIASPPGGIDHGAALAAGVDLVWARGLGSRAPRSSGDIRFAFIEDVLRRHARPQG